MIIYFIDQLLQSFFLIVCLVSIEYLTIKLIIKFQKYNKESMMASLGVFNRVNSVQLDSKKSMTRPSSDYREVIALQSKACSNLFELSNNICEDDYDRERQRKLQLKRQNYGFSPWKLKNQTAIDNHSSRKKKCSLRSQFSQKNTKQIPSYDNQQNKQNISFLRPISKCDDLKKYPSIFLRLMAAKEVKNSMKNKLDENENEIQIVTIMKKRKSNPVHISQARQPQIQPVESNLIYKKPFSKRLQQLQSIKKKSMAKFSTKHLPSNYIEFQNEDIEKEILKKDIVSNHWKTKNINVKNKRGKKLQNCKQAKSIDKKDQQTIMAANKKDSFSLQNKLKQDYHTSNPLTRLLYQKYLNTISISHQMKDEKFNFL